MKLIFELLVSGWIAPLLVCGGVTTALLRSAKLGRLAFAGGLAAAFLTAVTLLPWLPWFPASHWQWLPILSLIAGMAVPAAEMVGSLSTRRLLAIAAAIAVSALAATVLVPSWPRLEHERPYIWLGCVTAMLLVGLPTQRAVERLPSQTTVLSLTIIAMAASLLLFLGESLKFAQLGGILVSVGMGWWVAVRFERQPLVSAGLGDGTFVYCLLLLGLLICGYLNSFSGVPWGCYALVGTSPLLLGVARRIAQVESNAAVDPAEPSPTLERPGRFYALLCLVLVVAVAWGALAAIGPS